VQGVINAFVIFLSRVLAFLAAQALAGNRSSDDDRPSMGQAFLEFALVIAFEILFTLLGAIVVAWFSRKREFRADAGGMLLAGKAQMVGALQALQRIYDPQLASEGASSGLQALKISGKSGGLMALFATHPPLEERIAHLESLGR